jgi:hypothetical protein
MIMDTKFRIFYSSLFFTTLLPYLSFIIPVIPKQILGFNLTGWAWIIMFIVTMLLLYDLKNVSFPVFIWMPWIIYLLIYIITDYSFLGFQLTLQYILPILVGVIASGFTYSYYNLTWLFRWFVRLCLLIYIAFLVGILFLRGLTPSPSATPMLFLVLFSLMVAIYFMTREIKYLLYSGLILLVSVIGLRRMGIAATSMIFVIHFANWNLRSKIVYGIIAAIILLFIFNSKRFQEATFYGEQGQISDITFDYYGNKKIRNSGRQTWKIALQPGLDKEPIWGNGPRADNVPLTKITGGRYGEAHNDYLAVRYNYGYVGLFILLGGFLMNFISLFRVFRKYSGNDYIWLISTSVLSLFIGFLMFMYSDNILKYTIFFPNYFFTLAGIVYSLKRDETLIETKSL